ncbi:MAG TPA: hypothetical protein VFG54_07155 [Prolixibacteraceae bacterium]|nr:hypothetical protein [Prolixibacteraceae bacterium]
MIKLGIFGDQSSHPELVKMVKNIPGVTVAGVYFSGNVPVPKGFKEFFSPVELMRTSDAILVLNDKSISSDLIRLILRKSKHVYLKALPSLNRREIKELIDLEKEAGIVNFIYNPFDFTPHFDSLIKKNEKPVLINLRTCFEGSSLKPANELLFLVTALNRVVQNNYKKSEVFGLKNNAGQLVVNIRVDYEDSSVVNLTMTVEKTSGYCEIFNTSGRIKFEFDQPLYNAYPDIKQEYAAICNFIKIINLHDKPANSFDNLLIGVRIVDEINEHLRFNDILF